MGFTKEVNELDTMIHKFDYEIIANYIIEILKKVESFQNRIIILLKNEELLFNYRAHSFEEFERRLLMLKKY